MFRCVVSLLLLLSSQYPAIAQPTVLVPLPELAERLRSLERGEDRTRDVRALSEWDEAAPYLRAVLASATGRYKRDLEESLRQIDARIWQRTAKRYKYWVSARRFDLCNDVIVASRSDKEAEDLIGAVTPILNDVGAEAATASKLRPGAPNGLYLMPHEGRVRAGLRFSDDDVRVKSVSTADNSIIRAIRCQMEHNDPTGPFVAVRDSLTYPKDGINRWMGAHILVNNATNLKAADGTLLVCDGDLRFVEAGQIRYSLVIANGSIRCEGTNSFTDSVLVATGDIEGVGDNHFFAGGKVLGKPKVPAAQVQEGRKSLPFGVKFVDPREFGLELVGALRAGVGVNRVEADSVFAKHDIRGGDLITHANGQRVESSTMFRRQLRLGVLQESLVLHLIRDGKSIARVVYLDGVPLPQAPAPRLK
jgi:hypothetical protein